MTSAKALVRFLLTLAVGLLLAPGAPAQTAKAPAKAPAKSAPAKKNADAKAEPAKPVPSPDEILASKAEEYLAAASKARKFSGSVLIARNGKPFFSRGIGFANAEWEIPNTPQTKFRLGSITKQFTATLMLKLQEQGKLSVQDPMCQYIEPCPEAWKPVTLHHLLTHTSGIPSYTGLPDYVQKMMMPVKPDDIAARVRDLPLEFAPGERFKYNNSGYFLLGMIIEKVAGKKYEDALQEMIFTPLEMRDTGYDHPETLLPRRASGYSPGSGGLANARYLDMMQPYAAGSLYSTVEDLLKWDQALYTEAVLPRAALEAMFTPFKGDYAYGWAVPAVGPQTFGKKQIAHGGGINGFSTYIARYPEEGITIIVLGNNEAVPAGRIARDLGAIVFGAAYEMPVERKVVKVVTKVLDTYVGQYQLAPNFILTITREGDRLFAQATNQSRFEIQPESETRFFTSAVEAVIEFVKDSDGKVLQLLLHQGGRSTPGKRMP